MISFIKRLIPWSVKRHPNGLYNRIRKISGVARCRYNALKKEIDRNQEIARLFPEDKMRNHYVHEIMRQSTLFPVLFVNQIRYYRIYKFFQENYPELFDNETRIINVGDTSGVLFRAMGKSGLSVNINRTVVESMKKNGFNAEVQNAEDLKYRDKSFDYGFCFQCLEHLKNPLKALDELGRVVKKNVFLSIPYVERSSICNKGFSADPKKVQVEHGGFGCKDVLDSDCHVFLFSTKDMQNVLDFTQLEYVDSFPINYFTKLGTTRKNKNSFFNFFILRPRK